MKRYATVLLVAGLFGLAGTWVNSQDEPAEPDPTALLLPDGFSGEDAQVPEGAQPVLRGPVHEAFAQPARIKPQPGPIVPKEPPKPIEEIPPDQKPAGENVQWIPGYWFWDEEKQEYLWVSGIWRAIPPGMEWVPGTWVRVEGGWQWVPGYWKPVAQKEVEVVPEPPEPPPLAEPPPPPGPDYFYAPGTWVYVSYRWYWRPGVWVACHPGWVWVPACYYWTPYGCIFVDGYWDYPLGYRGFLFCPVWVDFGVCYRPGWFWRPCYWVPEPCLLPFLFVHTQRFCFFFGDYFAPFYARTGFVSIYYYRVHRNWYDPLVGYYAFAYGRRNPNWLAQQRILVQGRMQGTVPRPPRTLDEQRKLLASAAGDPERQAKLRQLVVAGSINRVNPRTVPTSNLDDKQLAALRKSIDETRQVQLQRAALERKLTESKPVAGKPPAKIQPVAVKSTAQVTVSKPPPPPPVTAQGSLKAPASGAAEAAKEPAKSVPAKSPSEKTVPVRPGETSKPVVKPVEEKTAPAKPASPPAKPSGSEKPSVPVRPSEKPGPTPRPPEKSSPPKPTREVSPRPTGNQPPIRSQADFPSREPTNRPTSPASPVTPPRGTSEPRIIPNRPVAPRERTPARGSRPERSGRPDSAIPIPPTGDDSLPVPVPGRDNSSRRITVSGLQNLERNLPTRTNPLGENNLTDTPVRIPARSPLVVPERSTPPLILPRSGNPASPRAAPTGERSSRSGRSSHPD